MPRRESRDAGRARLQPARVARGLLQLLRRRAAAALLAQVACPQRHTRAGQARAQQQHEQQARPAPQRAFRAALRALCALRAAVAVQQLRRLHLQEYERDEEERGKQRQQQQQQAALAGAVAAVVRVRERAAAAQDGGAEQRNEHPPALVCWNRSPGIITPLVGPAAV